uniref:non-specific serine/threonine protein kinase n=1 Tax=Trichuris muris TaxID=70415 RepID=A0A5S6QJB9_TRIMR
MDATLEGPPAMSFVHCDSTDERGRTTRVAALQVVGGFRPTSDSPAAALPSDGLGEHEDPENEQIEGNCSDDRKRFLLDDEDSGHWKHVVQPVSSADEHSGCFSSRLQASGLPASDLDGPPLVFVPSSDAMELSTCLQFPRVDSADFAFNGKQRRPKLIDKYLLGDLLGEGSYAKVKEAIDCETLCRLAVKIIKKRRLRKIPNGEQDVANEVRLLHRLSHQNVIELHDVVFNADKQKLYLFMGYCVGSIQEMLDRSEEKKFPRWQAHAYFVQLLDGLQYLHGQGVVHKDIKPGNLLLTVSEVLKITDLGVAEELNRFSPNDLLKSSRGTPKFQPPEIATGLAEFHGFLVDVWSAGVTLYNFVSGLYPFDGENVFRLYENICQLPLTLPPDTEPLLGDLLSGMLEKSIGQRFNLERVRTHDWVRKKHPRTLERVLLPCFKCDPSRQTTVYPYIEMLYADCTIGKEGSCKEPFVHEKGDVRHTVGAYRDGSGASSRQCRSRGRLESRELCSNGHYAVGDGVTQTVGTRRRGKLKQKFSMCHIQ